MLPLCVKYVLEHTIFIKSDFFLIVFITLKSNNLCNKSYINKTANVYLVVGVHNIVHHGSGHQLYFTAGPGLYISFAWSRLFIYIINFVHLDIRRLIIVWLFFYKKKFFNIVFTRRKYIFYWLGVPTWHMTCSTLQYYIIHKYFIEINYLIILQIIGQLKYSKDRTFFTSPPLTWKIPSWRRPSDRGTISKIRNEGTKWVIRRTPRRYLYGCIP